MASDLVDRIYEAAVIPNLWVETLTHLSDAVGGAGASFVTGARDQMRWVATPSMDEVIRFYLSGRVPENTRLTRCLAVRYPGFQTDLDLLSLDEIEAEPFYTDFMRPLGYGWCGGTVIFVPSADPIILSVEKRFADGPMDRAHLPFLDGLRPHLARAAALSAQLALEQARATTEALGRIGLPAAVLGAHHRLRAANGLFDALIPDLFQDSRERLRSTEPAADLLLAQALGDVTQDGASARSIPVRSADGRPPAVLHLVPVRRSARDVFGGGTTILIVTSLAGGSVPGADLLEGLFDLTPAEARVARAIGEGRTIAQIALQGGQAQNTVRSQLKAIFAKTATRRQAELAQLLSRAGQVLPPNSQDL